MEFANITKLTPAEKLTDQAEFEIVQDNTSQSVNLGQIKESVHTDFLDTLDVELGSLVELPHWNDDTFILSFRTKNGQTLTIDLPLESLAKDIDYDRDTKEIVLIRYDGSEIRIDVSDLIDIYTGSTGSHIQIEVDSGNVIRATLLSGSISETDLSTALTIKINGKLDTVIFETHDNNEVRHITETERESWNNKLDEDAQAVDSAKLGGELPEHYATVELLKQTANDLQEQIEELSPEGFEEIQETLNSLETRVEVIESVKEFEPLLKTNTANRNSLILKGGTRLKVGNKTFYFENDQVITGSTFVNGRDFYAALTYDGELLILNQADKITAGSDVKVIGGCHTLCANAGSMTYAKGDTTIPHPLSGWMASEILPGTVWSLNHRPYSEPEGMFYVPDLDFWCDIYLPSGSGFNTKSVYQGAITRNRQYVDFVEDMICVKKELLNDSEFAAAAMGSNEMTAVQGASEAGATTGGAGGRVDTAGRRMISIYGGEEMCGSLWQWLASTSAAGSSGWNAQSGGKGQYYGACYVLRAGGHWNDAARCGSRSRNAADARSDAYAYSGGRGRSRAIHLAY